MKSNDSVLCIAPIVTEICAPSKVLMPYLFNQIVSPGFVLVSFFYLQKKLENVLKDKTVLGHSG